MPDLARLVSRLIVELTWSEARRKTAETVADHAMTDYWGELRAATERAERAEARLSDLEARHE